MVLQQEGSYIYGGALVTVTSVHVSPDLLLAKVYLSIYNADDKDIILAKIEESAFRLRNELHQRVRKHVRRVPDLDYYIDDTLDEMYRVDALFKKLEADNQMGKSEEEES